MEVNMDEFECEPDFPELVEPKRKTKTLLEKVQGFLNDHEQQEVTITILSQDDQAIHQGRRFKVHFNYHNGEDWMGRSAFSDNLDDPIDYLLGRYKADMKDRKEKRGW